MATIGSAKATLVNKIDSLTSSATAKDTIFLAKALKENTSHHSFTFLGAWAASTAYALDDVVTTSGKTYICILAYTSGSSFAVGSNWSLMAEKGTDGSNGASGIPSGGSVGQVVTNTSAGAGDWADAAGGGILQAKSTTYDGHASIGGTFAAGQLGLTMTPKKADSSYLFMAQCFFGYSNHDVGADIGFDVSGAAPGGLLTPEGSAGGDGCFAISGIGTTAALSTLDDWSVGTLPAHFLWTPSSNLGTASRTFQVLSRRRGSAGSIRWNAIWGQGSDARNLAPVSVLTVFEIDSGIL